MAPLRALLAAAAVGIVAVACLAALVGWIRGLEVGASPMTLLDREWVDAIPAFGAAMSTDDLTRQISWLHKHNAAKPSRSDDHPFSSSPPLPPPPPPPPPPLPPLSPGPEAFRVAQTHDSGPSWLTRLVHNLLSTPTNAGKHKDTYTHTQ